MARLEIHLQLWPLFVTIMPARFDVEDVAPYIAQVDDLYRRKERFATLVDTSKLDEIPSAATRRLMADWQNATIDKIRAYNVCTATVLTSPLVRSAMTAMRWLFRPPNEQVAVATLTEGFEFCTRRLREDRQPLPSGLHQLIERGGPITLTDLRLTRATMRP